MITEREIAQKIIHTSLRIKPDEQVQLSTYHHTLPMAEALAVECYLAGAIPCILLESDNLFPAMLSEIPAANLGRTRHFLLAASQRLDAAIYIGGPEDPEVFGAGSPERMGALDQANKPLSDLLRQRKVREVGMSWGQCTPQRARQNGIDYQAWRETSHEAMRADYQAIAAVGKRLTEVLENGSSIHITAGDRTDLTQRLATRPVFVNDGILDDADLAHGLRFTGFPDGTVSLAPDEQSANGHILFPIVPLWGKRIKDLRWTFKDGRLIDWSAAENGQVFEQYYAAGTGDKDRFGFLSIGINPLVRPVGFTFSDWLALGTITGGIGYNLDDGGANDSTFGQYGSISRSDLLLDGKPLIKDGRLLL